MAMNPKKAKMIAAMMNARKSASPMPPMAPDAGAGAGPMGAMKKGGKVKKMAKGGGVTRGDGIASRGKTRGMVC